MREIIIRKTTMTTSVRRNNNEGKPSGETTNKRGTTVHFLGYDSCMNYRL